MENADEAEDSANKGDGANDEISCKGRRQRIGGFEGVRLCYLIM